MNTQNIDQAKFLIKELLAVLKIIAGTEFNNELNHQLIDLKEKLSDYIV